MSSARDQGPRQVPEWGKLPRFAGKQRRGESFKSIGRTVIEIEHAAVRNLAERIDDEFVRACRHLRDCKGHVVVLGVGKSGHIGGKIAATLASTGTPAFFVHPSEASHGDLGMITPKDVVLALSNSGKTAEILAILPMLKRLKVTLIAMTGDPESPLARAARVHINVGVGQEACPLELAPTASTTATLAMGDALAIAIMRAEDKSREDFARSHPGGALGRRLLLQVGDVMHTGDEIPMVPADAPLRDALMEMTRKRLGMTAVADGDGRLLGIFTDGDLRRALDRDVDVHKARVSDVMTAGFKTIRADALAAEAVRLMEAHKINALVVVDDALRIAGALNMHDLLQAGVVRAWRAGKTPACAARQDASSWRCSMSMAS
jgi:arabinose-5-phosphate isomerase